MAILLGDGFRIFDRPQAAHRHEMSGDHLAGQHPFNLIMRVYPVHCSKHAIHLMFWVGIIVTSPARCVEQLSH